jgi:hypothetical protein
MSGRTGCKRQRLFVGGPTILMGELLRVAGRRRRHGVAEAGVVVA